MTKGKATLLGYNGYNGAWMGYYDRKPYYTMKWKTDFYYDCWGGREHPIAHEWGAGEYGYVIAFTLPVGRYDGSTLNMSNLGYGTPWPSASTSRKCYWSITDTPPKYNSPLPQGTVLLKGTISVSGLMNNWYSTNGARYPTDYITTESENFEVTSSDTVYYLYLHQGQAMRIGFKEPTIYLTNYTAPVYSITYHSNCDDEIGVPEVQTKTHDISIQFTSYSPTRRGYSFLGWATSSTGEVKYQPGDSYNDNTDIELYAIWEINSYRITLGPGEGSGEQSECDVEFGENYTLPGCEFEPPTTKEYKVNYIVTGGSSPDPSPSTASITYKFDCWIDINGKEYDPEDTYESGQDMTFFARWTVDTKTNYPIKLSPKVEEKGYIFTGWRSNEGNIYDPGSTYEFEPGETRLHGELTPIEYTVKLHDADNNVKTHIISYNNTYKFEDPSKIGYTFEGWTTSSENPSTDNKWEGESSGTWTYISGECEIEENNNISLYPIWSLNPIQINYKVYDNTIGFGSAAETNFGLSSVKDICEKCDNNPVKSHHKLTGWYTSDGNKVNTWEQIFDSATEDVDKLVCDVHAKSEPRFKWVYISPDNKVKKLSSCIKRDISSAGQNPNTQLRRLYPYIESKSE